MSRPIEFRAWDGKRWRIDFSVDSNGYIRLTQFCDEGEPGLIMHDWKLVEFSGLTDKNGVKIFEGDVYTQGDGAIRYKVIYRDAGFVGNQIGNKSLAGLSHFIEKIEIIGNIHQHPELLDGDDNE